MLVQSKGCIHHGERCRFTTSTGDSFTGRDVLIQDFYGSECQNPVRECVYQCMCKVGYLRLNDSTLCTYSELLCSLCWLWTPLCRMKLWVLLHMFPGS